MKMKFKFQKSRLPMFKKKPKRCPITDDLESNLVHTFRNRPLGETHFKFKNSKNYYRELWQFFPSRHFISINKTEIDTNYNNAYVEATYENLDKLKLTFNKIINLPREKSDNQGRVKLIQEFSSYWFKTDYLPKLLDIGSGLGIFPYAIKSLGWDCLAIDPDKKAIKHIKDLGIQALCGDFREIKPNNKFDIITLNKVLEHLDDPIKFLRETHPWISNKGFLYLELPDGELAFRDSPNREEFFIEHIHIFSIPSTIALIRKAGYLVHNISRLKEPSGKYTIRAFIFPDKS